MTCQGVACLGWARPGLASLGLAWHVSPWLVGSCHGLSRRCLPRLALAPLGGTCPDRSRPDVARPGGARLPFRGSSRRDLARLGAARLPEAWLASPSRVMPWHAAAPQAMARLPFSRQVGATPNRTRPDLARLVMARLASPSSSHHTSRSLAEHTHRKEQP